jgi:hypothetical protein
MKYLNIVKIESKSDNTYHMYPDGELTRLYYVPGYLDDILTCCICGCKYKTKNHYYHIRKHKRNGEFPKQEEPLMSDYILK